MLIVKTLARCRATVFGHLQPEYEAGQVSTGVLRVLSWCFAKGFGG